MNGTQLAAGCRDGIVTVWSYPICKIIFQINKDHSVAKIKWNPFRQDIFASRYDVNLFFIFPLFYIYIFFSIFRIILKFLYRLILQFKRNLLLWNTRANGDVTKRKNFHTLERDGGIVRFEWISAIRIAIGLTNGLIEIWQIDEESETTNSQIVNQFKHGQVEYKYEDTMGSYDIITITVVNLSF